LLNERCALECNRSKGHFTTNIFLVIIMNIFVARLNFKTRREDLEAAFAKFGQVTSAKIVKDRDTGRSKGFGFVEMANDAEAQAAIAALNETELDGRAIVVKPANPKSESGGGVQPQQS